MVKLGAGDRLKGKLDRSSWVDSTDWLEDAGDDPSHAPVEFLETESSAYRLSPTRDQAAPSLVPTNSSSKAAALVAVGLLVAALILISRPDGEDPFGQLPYDKQQEILERQGQLPAPAAGDTSPVGGVEPGASGSDETGSSTSAPDADDFASVDSGLPQPIPAPEPVAPLGGADPDAVAEVDVDLSSLPPVPPLSAELPADLPGMLAIYSEVDSVVFIDWARAEPQELDLGVLNDTFTWGPMVGGSPLVAPVLVPGSQFDWAVPEGGGWSSARVLAASSLLPADDGVALVTPVPLGGHEVLLATFEQVMIAPWSGTQFALSDPLEPLGGWQGQLLVYASGSVGTQDENGTLELLIDGEPIAFDGRDLVVVQCPLPGGCEIVSGPIEEPALNRVPVPAELLDGPLDSWITNAALSSDGTRLAIANQRRNSELAWIDLETGAYQTRRAGYLVHAPMAWSPDGRWLAYAANGNLHVWDTESDETSLVLIGRPIDSLVWFDEDS